MVSVSVYVDVIESVEVEVIVAVTELQEGLSQRFALTVGNGLWNKSKKHRQRASPKSKSEKQVRKASPKSKSEKQVSWSWSF